MFCGDVSMLHMSQQDVEKIVHEYIKSNLTIEQRKERDDYSVELTTKIYLKDELITKSTETIEYL